MNEEEEEAEEKVRSFLIEEMVDKTIGEFSSRSTRKKIISNYLVHVDIDDRVVHEQLTSFLELNFDNHEHTNHQFHYIVPPR